MKAKAAEQPGIIFGRILSLSPSQQQTRTAVGIMRQ
jgi:hypothetical protein